MVEGTVGCGGVAFLMSWHQAIFSRIFCNHHTDNKSPWTPSLPRQHTHLVVRLHVLAVAQVLERVFMAAENL